MKPFEIALFKHFIGEKGMTTVWINLYRKNHLKENPISIEEFLLAVDPKDVMMKAFRFYVNSDYGFDYWSKMTEWWLVFLDSNKDNYTADEWYMLRGMSKILRTNWDAAKHWKEDSRLATALRYGIDPSILGIKETECLPEPTRMSEEYLREKTNIEINGGDVKDDANAALIDFGDTDDDNKETGTIFGEFELMSLRPKANDRRRLRDDEISLNTRNDKGRLTFNQKISNEIKSRGGYEYASLLRNKKGEVLLWLNDTDKNGVSVQDGLMNARKNINVSISSKVMVKKIMTFLDIKHDYEIIKVTEIEKTNDYVAYLLTNK